MGSTLVFLIVALIAAAFGLGGVVAAAAGIAKVLYVAKALFIIFLTGAIASFLMDRSKGDA